MDSRLFVAIAAVASLASPASARPFSSMATTVLPFAFSIAGIEAGQTPFDVLKIDVRNGPSDLKVTIRCKLTTADGASWTDDGQFSFTPMEIRQVRLPTERRQGADGPSAASCVIVSYDAPGLNPD